MEKSVCHPFRDVSTIARGYAQLGDVVGTMYGGWNLEVRSGNMYITAFNKTHLEGYYAGNALGDLGLPPLVRNPTVGPLSPVTQRYTFVVPVPAHLQPAPPPRSRNGQE